jgi:hypothetical protein
MSCPHNSQDDHVILEFSGGVHHFLEWKVEYWQKLTESAPLSWIRYCLNRHSIFRNVITDDKLCEPKSSDPGSSFPENLAI